MSLRYPLCNQDRLEALERKVRSVRPQGWPCTISTAVCDLSSTADLEHHGRLLFSLSDSVIDGRVFEKAIFVNNAGSLGELNRVGEFTALAAEISSTFQMNVSASCYLTSEFMRRYASSDVKAIRVVNVSSKCATEPYPTWSLYCAGKAARDMFHRVLAVENMSDARVKVLNYAPGPLDTEVCI